MNKIREDMVGGPSIVFTRKAIGRKPKFVRLKTCVRLEVGIDASQLYSFSMCQEMPTGLYARWEIDAKKKKFVPI